MSWLNDLYQTYENNQKQVAADLTAKAILLPIAHSTQNAQIELVLDSKGELSKAELVPKKEAVTIIPVTEDSASRAGKAAYPHPLADKLEYLAKDYEKYTGLDNSEKTQKYFAQLEAWCDSSYSLEEIKAVKAYLEKGTVIKDLLDSGIFEEQAGRLTDKKIEGIEQKQVFIRFSVQSSDIFDKPKEIQLYKNTDVFDAYIKYYLGLDSKQDWCYASGQLAPCSTKHPSKIRNTGDKAKLISSNDTSGFTFRGRFSEASQVASVSYEVSQKAHNALKWLISLQGFSVGELTIVAWETSGKKLLKLEDDTEDSFFALEDEEEVIDTNITYAKQLERAVKSYKLNLGQNAEVVILALEAATTGRLSIRFYRKLAGSLFLDNVYKWHRTCFWRHFYKKKDIEGVHSFYTYEGAPALKDIAQTAFGDKNEKVLKSTMERLLPCVVDGRPLPIDIMRAALNKVMRPSSYDNGYFWQKAISITCALVRKYRFDKYKEEWSMDISEECLDRSYLFGRLLGAARKLEEVALFLAKETGRETSAERLMQHFVKHPKKTLAIIENNLSPYKARLKAVGKNYYALELQRIYGLISVEDFQSDEPLSELYLLGYNCQLNSYGTKKKEQQMEEKEND